MRPAAPPAAGRNIHEELEPETRKMLLAQGLDAAGSSQEQFSKDYQAEMTRWAKVVNAVGVQLN